MAETWHSPDGGAATEYAVVDRFAGYKVTTAPVCEPVTPAMVRDNLRQDVDVQDAMLQTIITACREAVESSLNRTILNTTYSQVLDDWPRCISPVRPPLVSVSSIKYLDTDGNEQTLGATNYRVDSTSEPARITRERGVTWPTLRGVPAQVTVNFVAGYPSETGALTANHSGSVVTISIDGLSTTPNPSGLLYLINATGQNEVVPYRSYALDSGVYTFNVSTDDFDDAVTLKYSYADDDAATVHNPPSAIQQAIIAMAVDVFEHPELSPEISLNKNATVKMLLGVFRLPQVGA